MDPTTLIETLRARVPGATFDPVETPDYTTLYVSREHIVPTLQILRDDPGLSFVLLSEITAVDYLPREPRFDVVYHLTRMGVPDFPRPGMGGGGPARLRLKVKVADGETVPTSVNVFSCANWLEREVWDLFGIVFEGHPDLRRLLLPDDWEGHALRKDYPVQVKLPYKKTEAMELTEEEFLANMQRQRAGAQPPRR